MAPPVDQALPKVPPALSHAEPPQDQLNALFALYNHGRLEEVVRQATATAVDFPHAIILYNLPGSANAELHKWKSAATGFI
jgi:hypothetical protein